MSHESDDPNVIPISAAQKAAARRTEDRHTELYVSEIFVERYAGDFRYLIGGGWHRWVGTHYSVDHCEARKEFVKRIARELARDAVRRGDNDMRRLVQRVATARGISAVLELARSDERVVFGPDQANSDPWALNCLNGTVDLRDGSLRPHDKADLITRCTSVVYDASASAPRFDQFLEEIQPEEEVRRYLGRLIGYAAVGVTRELADC